MKKILLSQGITSLYPPQEEAIKKGALNHENLVLAIPTASGKTLVAELAMLKSIIEEGGKALYLVPLRALANEKYDEFKKYEQIGVKVAVSTGDYDSSDKWLENYDIIICSIDYNEPIVIKENGAVKSIRIGEFVDKLMEKSNKITFTNGCEVLDISDLNYETLAFDPQNYRIRFKKISKIIRHKITEPLHKLYLETEREITVTSSHSVYVLENLNIKAKRVSEIQVGDYVLIPRRLPIQAIDTKSKINPFTLTQIPETHPVCMLPADQVISILKHLNNKLFTHSTERISREHILNILNSIKIKILDILTKHKKLNSRDISVLLKIRRIKINPYLRSLLKKGLIKRNEDNNDPFYSISKRGLALLEKIKKLKRVLNSDFAFAKVKKIVQVSSSSNYVYDVSVPGCENFIAGLGGVICHNTNEKADSLLRHHSPWLSKLTVIVADEIHLINDPHRGPTLEVVLARLRQVNPSAQLLALSATIKNAEEIANWLNAKLVLSNWRPVILKEGIYDGDIIEFNDGTVKKPKRFDNNPVVSLAIDTVYEGGQSLVFLNTRRSAVSMATKTAKTLPKLLSKSLQRTLAEVADEILRRGTRTQQSEKLAELVKRGVAFHHAGLHYEHRKIIEDTFRQNIIKIICATPTLAAGVNLPARRVIIRDYYRYESDLGHYPIPILEYKQQAGRAGRPKYDKVGEAILIAKSEEEKRQLFETYIFGEPEKIWSKLANEQALRTHVLSTISAGYANSEKSLLKFINETFYAYQYDPEDIRSIIRKILNFLTIEKLLVESDHVFLPTPLGKRTSELYIDPLTTVIIREGLLNAKKEKITPISILHLISHTPDMVKLYLRRKDYQKFMEIVDLHHSEFLVEVPDYLTQPTEYEWFLSEVKVAQLLQDWIDEKTEDEILQNYGIGSGDLLRIVETADWLLYAAEEIAKIIKRDNLISKIWKIRQRVKHGVKEELLELVRLKGIGRVRARILYRYGFKSIFDLQKATTKELLSLPLIGPEIVKNIKKQIGGNITESDITLLKKEEKKQKRLTDYS